MPRKDKRKVLLKELNRRKRMFQTYLKNLQNTKQVPASKTPGSR